MARRPAHRAALLASAALIALSGCGGADDEGTGGERAQGGTEAHREGLALELGGLKYNVFITRQLNLALPEDRAYYDGEPEQPGQALYGVFLQVCNEGDEPREAASEFKIVDSQGEEFEPIPLPATNAFAYPLPHEEGEEPAGEAPGPAEESEGDSAQEADGDEAARAQERTEDEGPRVQGPPPANPLEIEPAACIPLTGSVAQLGPTAGSMLLFDLPRDNTENRPLELEIEHGSESLAFELDF